MRWLGSWYDGFEGVVNGSYFYYGDRGNYFSAGDTDWLAAPDGDPISSIHVEGTITKFAFTTPESGSTLTLLALALGLIVAAVSVVQWLTRDQLRRARTKAV